ncbi:MAG: hypothetical protein ACKPKO_57320, partial [Candidatus Fonsibacter sp.]
RSKNVWDENHPRDWDEVRSDARRGGYTVHMGYIFGICVEKNAELDPFLRKFKDVLYFKGIRCMIKIITTRYSRTWEVRLPLYRQQRQWTFMDACLVTV